MNDAAEVDKLKAFVQDELLEELESRTGGFNIFTALSLERAEIRHSSVLAWLLDPRSSHGLGDYFLKAFLRHCARQPENRGATFPSVFDLDSWDLDEVEVRREWRNIDILLIDRTHKFLVLIENKIDSGQHGAQLSRYREIVKAEFRDLRKGFVYLTVEEEDPEDDAYLSVTYRDLLPVLNKILGSRQGILGTDVATFITHYIHLVERNIVQDSDIQKICREIYKRHRDAIDLILRTIPTALSRPLELFERALRADPEFILDDPSKGTVRFTTTQLDWIPKKAHEWTSSGRILLFHVVAKAKELELSLLMGRGDAAMRQGLYDACRGNLTIFNKANRKLTPVWFCLHKSSLATLEEIEEATDEAALELLTQRLQERKADLFAPIAAELGGKKTQLRL